LRVNPAVAGAQVNLPTKQNLEVAKQKQGEIKGSHQHSKLITSFDYIQI